jgi:hypothetical protein
MHWAQRGPATTPASRSSDASAKFPRYCYEFSFRWDERKVTDGERTVEAIKGAEGKRLIDKESAA